MIISIVWGISSIVFKAKNTFYYKCARLMATLIVKICKIKIVVYGNLPQERNVIYVANHKSLADTMALLTVFPDRTDFLFKAELLRTPGLGFALKHSPYISVERHNSKSAALSYSKAKHHLEQGKSLMIFPEGTWSGDHKLLPFKSGAFLLAKEMNIPIIPISLKGTELVINQESYLIHKGNIEIVFHEALSPSSFNDKSPEELSLFVKNIIESKL